jgi:hypothetical protein
VLGQTGTRQKKLLPTPLFSLIDHLNHKLVELGQLLHGADLSAIQPALLCLPASGTSFLPGTARHLNGMRHYRCDEAATIMLSSGDLNAVLMMKEVPWSLKPAFFLSEPEKLKANTDSFRTDVERNLEKLFFIPDNIDLFKAV